MNFIEKLPSKDELLYNPSIFAQLMVEKYCGSKWPRTKISSNLKELLYPVLVALNTGKINYRQFNEILLILNQNTVSSDFFEFFFETDLIDFDSLLEGIKKIRGFSMIEFGSFRHPFNLYRRSSKIELEILFEKCIRNTEELREFYTTRPQPILQINEIPKEETWCLGYISSSLVQREGTELQKQLIGEHETPLTQNELDELNIVIADLSVKIEEIRKVGQVNTEKYLTWDYIDVYIATSMRNGWEFEEINEVISAVFSSPELIPLGLRYFDPTQSYCSNPRDKGLVEGLMLKRADCTIYLAQENDTMGKDSELASTLVQGKPVLAFVPDPNPEEYAKKISTYPPQYFKKRFLTLNADIGFDDPQVLALLQKFGVDFEIIIQEYLDAYGNYRLKQPFSLFKRKDMDFNKEYPRFDDVCSILAEVECYNFSKRANTLRGIHPLSMQVVLETGVANGVIVVRNATECASILARLLTNDLEFEITKAPPIVNPLGEEEGYTTLVEKTTQSPFRVVTHQTRLTNSFWNNFGRKK